MEQQNSDKPVRLTWEVNPRDPDGVTAVVKDESSAYAGLRVFPGRANMLGSCPHPELAKTWEETGGQPQPEEETTCWVVMKGTVGFVYPAIGEPVTVEQCGPAFTIGGEHVVVPRHGTVTSAVRWFDDYGKLIITIE